MIDGNMNYIDTGMTKCSLSAPEACVFLTEVILTRSKSQGLAMFRSVIQKEGLIKFVCWINGWWDLRSVVRQWQTYRFMYNLNTVFVTRDCVMTLSESHLDKVKVI